MRQKYKILRIKKIEDLYKKDNDWYNQNFVYQKIHRNLFVVFYSKFTFHTKNYNRKEMLDAIDKFCNWYKNRLCYYVYVYLDPTTKSFKKEGYEFNHEPFYIGKGKKNRHLSHFSEANRARFITPKIEKIRSIFKKKLKPIVIKFKENLSEEQAWDLEKKLINEIGAFNDGPLLNRSF